MTKHNNMAKPKIQVKTENIKIKYNTYIYMYMCLYTEQNKKLLFLPSFFISWTQRSKTFSMCTKGLFLSNIIHKSV